MKRLVITPLAILALALAPVAQTAHVTAAVYADAVGDAGDAPDISRVTIRPAAGGVVVDVTLAAPTELGPYGWILFGVDADRNAYTGGGRGDELLLLANGAGVTLSRWNGRGFVADGGVGATLSGTDLRFLLRWKDLHTRAFDFSAASLRRDADLAPGRGVASYPAAGNRRRAR